MVCKCVTRPSVKGLVTCIFTPFTHPWENQKAWGIIKHRQCERDDRSKSYPSTAPVLPNSSHTSFASPSQAWPILGSLVGPLVAKSRHPEKDCARYHPGQSSPEPGIGIGIGIEKRVIKTARKDFAQVLQGFVGDSL